MLQILIATQSPKDMAAQWVEANAVAIIERRGAFDDGRFMPQLTEPGSQRESGDTRADDERPHELDALVSADRTPARLQYVITVG